MNSPKVIKAMRKVVDELLALPPEEFHKRLEQRKDGENAKMLRESGALDVWKTEVPEQLKSRGDAPASAMTLRERLAHDYFLARLAANGDYGRDWECAERAATAVRRADALLAELSKPIGGGE